MIVTIWTLYMHLNHSQYIAKTFTTEDTCLKVSQVLIDRGYKSLHHNNAQCIKTEVRKE